jgi:hypothetical protein
MATHSNETTNRAVLAELLTKAEKKQVVVSKSSLMAKHRME